MIHELNTARLHEKWLHQNVNLFLRTTISFKNIYINSKLLDHGPEYHDNRKKLLISLFFVALQGFKVTSKGCNLGGSLYKNAF